jgi:hypothetical protein
MMGTLEEAFETGRKLTREAGSNWSINNHQTNKYKFIQYLIYQSDSIIYLSLFIRFSLILSFISL